MLLDVTSEGGDSVVDKHPAVGQPEGGEDGDHRYQHLDNLMYKQQKIIRGFIKYLKHFCYLD